MQKNKHDEEDKIHVSIQNDAQNDISEESTTVRYLKRAFLFIVGLFLVYLSLTYLGVGPYMLQIFEGQIVSREVNENFTVSIGNQTTIIFEEELYNELLQYYVAHQRYEFAACFFGNRTETRAQITETTTETNNEATTEKIYLLTTMEIPHMYSQSVHRVTSTGCPVETLVSLHTHPYKHCLFSEQDINSFFIFQQRAPNGLYALMCEEDRFTFYGY